MPGPVEKFSPVTADFYQSTPLLGVFTGNFQDMLVYFGLEGKIMKIANTMTVSRVIETVVD